MLQYRGIPLFFVFVLFWYPMHCLFQRLALSTSSSNFVFRQTDRQTDRRSYCFGILCIVCINVMQCLHHHQIEDVERGAELSFSGPRVRFANPPPLCIIVKFWFQTTKFWFQTDRQTDRQTDGRTDRQTDGQTDAINIFWAFLVKN